MTVSTIDNKPQWLQGTRLGYLVDSPVHVSVAVRFVLFLGCVVASFHHTLGDLASTVSTNSPLAYLGMVPFLALVIGIRRARPQPGELTLPQRDVDWIVGAPLLAMGWLIAVPLSGALTYDFWSTRLDIVALPFYVGGLVAILFGARVLSRVRWPVLSLFLAWSIPYEDEIGRFLESMAIATASTLARIAPMMPDVEHMEGTLFTLGTGSEGFIVNVAPTCAGASGAIGFALIGSALQSAIVGRMRSRVLWVLVGVVVMLTLNVARLATLFFVGAKWGETAAIEYLHPYAGLVLFIAGTVLMVSAFRFFGLSWRPPTSKVAPPATPLGEDAAGLERAFGVRAIGLVLLLATLVTMSPANVGLARFDPFRDLDSAAPVSRIENVSPVIDGWQERLFDEVSWAAPYYGNDSTWYRHQYYPERSGNRVLFVDVVTVGQLDGLQEFDLDACYRFHDYNVQLREPVDVGSAAAGEAIAYQTDDGRSWALVSWTTPVVDDGERFERVTVITLVEDGDVARSIVDDHLVPFASALYASTDTPEAEVI